MMMMRVLKIVLALFLLLSIVHVQPNQAIRVMNMKKQLGLMETLDKGPVPPSGPSSCTFIPGSGGTRCPPVNEMNVAGNVRHRRSGFARSIRWAVSSNQHLLTKQGKYHGF
ncbi:hypothetical protein PIB30_011203 [Stylosanthes scabra]|uniref:Transmembrane protein n=1 Tax=Stylosanthes scabra TaxID=79078 RepID=A0ABU6S5A6_9FABA|nr:hypothetical protein [Stylosanthes scabra]